MLTIEWHKMLEWARIRNHEKTRKKGMYRKDVHRNTRDKRKDATERLKFGKNTLS